MSELRMRVSYGWAAPRGGNCKPRGRIQTHQAVQALLSLLETEPAALQQGWSGYITH